MPHNKATGGQCVGKSMNWPATPPGADIELGGAFDGNTPSTIMVTAGDHAITLKKSGFAPWERTIKVSGGNIQISAELQASEGTPVQPAQ